MYKGANCSRYQVLFFQLESVLADIIMIRGRN